MLECWKEDKQRPTMKELVEVVRGWDPSTWDHDVISVPLENGGRVASNANFSAGQRGYVQ